MKTCQSEFSESTRRYLFFSFPGNISVVGAEILLTWRKNRTNQTNILFEPACIASTWCAFCFLSIQRDVQYLDRHVIKPEL
mmetsp:Transcript_2699/g.10383  ORF Transcript_2699/g.10383 Transcript_2699/m.10383 type:complete len:81 (+) Transcript_2699:1944-2186(+)